MVHGVLPNLGGLTTAAPPERLRVARVREVSLRRHRLARSINKDGESAPLVDADVGSLQTNRNPLRLERANRKGKMDPLRRDSRLQRVEFRECGRGCRI
jgi:hypothetical protein